MARTVSEWPSDGFPPCVDCLHYAYSQCVCDKEPPTEYVDKVTGYVDYPQCRVVRGTKWCFFVSAKNGDTHLGDSDRVLVKLIPVAFSVFMVYQFYLIFLK